MGRLDFTAQRVHQAATLLYQNNRIAQLPVWHRVMDKIPPPEILTRPPKRFNPPHGRGRPRAKKPSKVFAPVELKYPEDNLRREFFGDHPWELARPTIVLENGGDDFKGFDWSNIVQKGKKLDGESVIQRQLWLMENKNLPKAVAYDQARKEFYEHRHLQDIQRRVAKEEAMATGAYFGKSENEIGMELEDRSHEDWKKWAANEIERLKQIEASSYIGAGTEEGAEIKPGEEEEQALEEVSDNIPNTNKGQKALGGAAVHP